MSQVAERALEILPEGRQDVPFGLRWLNAANGTIRAVNIQVDHTNFLQITTKHVTQWCWLPSVSRLQQFLQSG